MTPRASGRLSLLPARVAEHPAPEAAGDPAADRCPPNAFMQDGEVVVCLLHQSVLSFSINAGLRQLRSDTGAHGCRYGQLHHHDAPEHGVAQASAGARSPRGGLSRVQHPDRRHRQGVRHPLRRRTKRLLRGLAGQSAPQQQLQLLSGRCADAGLPGSMAARQSHCVHLPAPRGVRGLRLLRVMQALCCRACRRRAARTRQPRRLRVGLENGWSRLADPSAA